MRGSNVGKEHIRGKASGLGFIRFLIDAAYELYLHQLDHGHHHHHPSRVKFNFRVQRAVPKEKGEGIMFEAGCTTEEKVLVTISPVTEAGAPVTPVNGITISVTSGDGSFEIVDNTSFYLVSGSLVGDTQYAISAEFDPDGDGTTESLADSIVLHVGQPKVTGFGFAVVSEPILK
jgi:hypothetical protein